MKKLIVSLCIVAVTSLATAVTFASLGTVKVECWGDCGNERLAEACRTYNVDSYAIDISCDDTADPWASRSCGNGATCGSRTPIFSPDLVGESCADGGGNDAIVECSTVADRPYAVTPVPVECWGDCNRVSVSEVCGSLGAGMRPIGVACDDTATPGSGWQTACGNGPTCTPWGNLAGNDPVGAYCADGAGYDALVLCTQNPWPSSVGAIKVETWGVPAQVNLGQICDTYSSNSRPIGVRCDDTADPGSGTPATCGVDGTCTPWSLTRSSALSAYCADGAGNDAIVMCTNDTFPR